MSPLRPLTILKAAAERAARGETLLKLGECAVHAEPVERVLKPSVLGKNGLRNLGLALAVGALCVVAGAVPSLGSCPLGEALSCQPKFNLNGYDKGAKTPINTCKTNDTVSSPIAWADVSTAKENFLACSLETTGPIALCYYSGVPGEPNLTPSCTFSQDKRSAQCDCYQINKDNPTIDKTANYSYILITSILNKNVYEETVAKCGLDSSACLNAGDIKSGKPEAPVCDALRNKTLFPGADLISDFSPILISIKGLITTATCDNRYAGCMTAPCKNTGKIDPSTGLPIVKCTCPTYNGPNQVGNPQISSSSCSPTPHVWSSAFSASDLPMDP